jgi:hypothetical protein
VNDMPEQVLDPLRHCQVFPGDNPTDAVSALALLKHFSNVDKHRLPHVAAVSPRSAQHAVQILMRDEVDDGYLPELVAGEQTIQLSTQVVAHFRLYGRIEHIKGEFTVQAQVMVRTQMAQCAGLHRCWLNSARACNS